MNAPAALQVLHDGKPRLRVTTVTPVGCAVEVGLAGVDELGRITFSRREVATVDSPGLELLADHDRARIRSALLVLSGEPAHGC